MSFTKEFATRQRQAEIKGRTPEKKKAIKHIGWYIRYIVVGMILIILASVLGFGLVTLLQSQH